MTTDSDVMTRPAGEWGLVICPGCDHPFCPEYSDAEALNDFPILYCGDRCRKRVLQRRYRQGRRLRDAARPTEAFIPGCTDKVFYLDLKYANQALERVRLRYPNTKGIPVRAYHCKQCGGAHLTSQPGGTD